MHSAQTRRARTGNRTVASGRYPGHHKGVLPASTTELEVRAGVFRQPAMQTPVLVLNASYEPINICGARRALVLVLKGVARTEEEQGATLHAQTLEVKMPSVIRLLEYRRIPHQTRALSRKNILLRDRNMCQYCQVVLTGERADARPRDAALAWWAVDLGESGGVLPQLQSTQGQPAAA